MPRATVVNLTNVVRNTIKVDSVSNCLSKTNFDQKILFSGMRVKCAKDGTFEISNVGNYVYSEVISKCLQSNGDLLRGVNSVMETLPKDVPIESEEEEGLTKSEIIGISTAVIIIILFICLGVGLGIGLKK